ncbi:hypothetical protein BD410DRAFT_846495, partial [Rickenella mellea]
MDASSPRPAKRQRLSEVNARLFLDTEAQVVGDESSEEEEENGDFLDDNPEHDPGHTTPAIFRAIRDEDTQAAFDLANRFKRDYPGDQRNALDRDCNGVGSLIREGLVEDPDWKVFIVDVKVGHEEKAAQCVSRKAHSLQLHIDAFACRSVSGHFYIQSKSLSLVHSLCSGLINIYPAKSCLVPENNLVDVFRLRIKETEPTDGAQVKADSDDSRSVIPRWVVLSRGEYKGDTALVMKPGPDDKLTLAIVPWIPTLDPRKPERRLWRYEDIPPDCRDEAEVDESRFSLKWGGEEFQH